MARFPVKIRPNYIGTWALPGMADARRDQVPMVRSRIGRCADCGAEARLPVSGPESGICSRCLP